MPFLQSFQLASLRSHPHTSNWYCVPIRPETVFMAQVVGFPDFGEVVIPYDTVVVGTFADVKKGMTLWVGTSPDANDVATMRIRLPADATNLYVAWNSDVPWTDNLYLTVKKQYLPWSVRQRIVPPVIYKDYDIAYTDQTNLWPPVAMMGDNVCKLWEGSPTRVWLDGIESYATAKGATITNYLWDFDDGTTSTAMSPTWHNYYLPGTYYPTLTVTDSNGKTHTTRRIVCLPEPSTLFTVNFEQTELSSQIGEGWKAKIRVFDPNANTANFPERAPCFIIAKDSYGGVEGSVGWPYDRQNIVMFGYIVEDSVVVQPEYNEVVFDLESIAGVLGRADSPPVFLSDANDPASKPDKWAWGKNLNVFRGLVYLLKFHSTAMDIADVQLYNDTTLTKMVDYPQDNFWNMLIQFAKGKRLMNAGVTRTGRVIVGRNPNLTLPMFRSFDTICQLQEGDWKEQVTIPQKPFPATSFCCISGLIYNGDPVSEPDPVFGMSPGRPPKEYGIEKEIQFLKFADQSECNILAGLIVGTDNMPYGDIVIPMNGNWTRVFDPAYQEYVRTPGGGFNTKRGNLLFDVQLIVRKVVIQFDWAAGTMHPTITCEYYSYPEVGVNGDCWPSNAPPPPRIIIPPIFPPGPPPLGQPPPVVGAGSASCSSGTSRISFSWTYGGTGSPVFYVERSLSATSGFVLIGTTSGTSYTDSTVTPGRTYYYRVRGKIGANYTKYSNVITQTAIFCVPVLSIAVINCVTARLTWTNVTGETTYQVERSTSPSSGFVQIATVYADVLTYDDLPPSRGVYYYRVRAQNAYASSAYSNVVSATVGAETWHPHVVLGTGAKIYEWNSGTFGIGYFPTPTDITGNITGTIIGVKFYGGQLLALTQDKIWMRVAGNVWTDSDTASLWAANSSLWTHEWWNEDGTGPHGHAIWGNRSFEHPGPPPCDAAHVGDALNPLIHWTYVASAGYMQLIGDNVTAYSVPGTSLKDCSLRNTGVWSTILAANNPTPLGFLADVTPPDVFDNGTSLHSMYWAAHFTPYASETLHDFNGDQGLGSSTIYFDNVDYSLGAGNPAPFHFCDSLNNTWAWGAWGGQLANGLYFNDGTGFVSKLAQRTIEGPFAASIPPGGSLVRVLLYAGGFEKSTDYGANWTAHPAPNGAYGIYVTEDEPNRLYCVSKEFVGGIQSIIKLWVSSDEGANWCQIWSVQGNTVDIMPLGIWADTAS